MTEYSLKGEEFSQKLLTPIIECKGGHFSLSGSLKPCSISIRPFYIGIYHIPFVDVHQIKIGRSIMHNIKYDVSLCVGIYITFTTHVNVANMSQGICLFASIASRESALL